MKEAYQQEAYHNTQTGVVPKDYRITTESTSLRTCDINTRGDAEQSHAVRPPPKNPHEVCRLTQLALFEAQETSLLRMLYRRRMYELCK